MKLEKGAFWSERFQFHPFWKVTNWGLSFWPFHHIFNLFETHKMGPTKLVDKACDEFRNPSLSITVPMIGWFVIFYGKNLDRSRWYFSGAVNGCPEYISPDYAKRAILPPSVFSDEDFDFREENFPTLGDEEIRVQATKIEATGI